MELTFVADLSCWFNWHLQGNAYGDCERCTFQRVVETFPGVLHGYEGHYASPAVCGREMWLSGPMLAILVYLAKPVFRTGDASLSVEHFTSGGDCWGIFVLPGWSHLLGLMFEYCFHILLNHN